MISNTISLVHGKLLRGIRIAMSPGKTCSISIDPLPEDAGAESFEIFVFPKLPDGRRYVPGYDPEHGGLMVTIKEGAVARRSRSYMLEKKR